MELRKRYLVFSNLLDQTMARNPHFNGEYDSILWFCGTTSIALVSLKDLSFVEYKNFLPSHGKGQDGIAIRGVMKNGGKEVLVFFIVENQPCLAYFGPGLSEPDILFVEDCLPGCKFILTSQKFSRYGA